MVMTAPSDDIQFSCPVIAPKVYIVTGPSGWTETFQRAKLDAELVQFLSPAPVADMVEVFINMRAAADKPEAVGWFTIVGFLGRTLGQSPRSIPPTVGIAFWAHIEIAKREHAMN